MHEWFNVTDGVSRSHVSNARTNVGFRSGIKYDHRGLRSGSAANRLLRLRIRTPPGAWTYVCCECCVLSVVKVPASGWSLLQMGPTECGVSYVYWNVHRLDSWIKRDQLDVTCFIISLFTVQHVSDVNTSILRSLRLVCWVISWVALLWFDACYVVVWLGWNNSSNKSQAPEDGCINIRNMLNSK